MDTVELSQQIDVLAKSGQVTGSAANTAKNRIKKFTDKNATQCFPINKGGIRCEWVEAGYTHILEVHANGVQVYEDQREIDQPNEQKL